MIEAPSARALAEETATAPLAKAVQLMRLLRSEAGCPWDRAQTMRSLQRYTLEEVYEVFDAIDREAWAELRDELGDLFLQVLFYAQIAEDAGHFDMDGVAAALNAKLVRRHPHVFGDEVAADAAAVSATWDRVKRSERVEAQAEGLLDSVSRSMPATLEATKLGSRAAKVGFDWPHANGILDKLEEEVRELRDEVEAAAGAPRRIEEELGDVLFTVMNLARRLDVDPEAALRGSNRRFRERFARIEALRPEGDGATTPAAAEEWERLWAAAKEMERTRP